TGDREPIQHFTMKDEYGNQLGDGHYIVFVDADYDGEWRLKDLMSDFKAKSPETFKYDVLKGRREGQQEEKKETIRRMLNKNFAIETIAQIAEVEKIKKK
ncbi:hypothetical protein, partial [uncultured Dubosiella sp.]